MESRTKKLFILGSTGYIGSFITKEYLNNGYEVVSVVRDAKKITDFESNKNIKYAEGNVNDLDYLRSVSEGFDVYIFAIGGTPEDSENIIKVLIEQSQASAKSFSSKFIYCSGCFVYGNNESLQNENSPCDNPVGSVKWKRPVEDYILSFNSKEQTTKYSFNTAVIRPSWVYGHKNDNYMNNYLRHCRDTKTVVVPKKSSTYTSLTHIEDTARVFYLVGNTEKVSGIFNSCDGVSLKARDFAEAVAKQVGCEITEVEEANGKVLGGFDGLFSYAYQLNFNLESVRTKELGHELKFKSFTDNIKEIFESL